VHTLNQSNQVILQLSYTNHNQYALVSWMLPKYGVQVEFIPLPSTLSKHVLFIQLSSKIPSTISGASFYLVNVLH